jgi:hypothetical protein
MARGISPAPERRSPPLDGPEINARGAPLLRIAIGFDGGDLNSLAFAILHNASDQTHPRLVPI